MSKTPSLFRSASLILIASFLLCGTASASSDVIGGSCTDVGVSKMADDQKNLLVCLKNDSGALIWKSMTSGGTPTISSYDASGSSNATLNIGTHKFCALGNAGVSGGCGRCTLYLSLGHFILDSASCSGSSYMWCSATCFD